MVLIVFLLDTKLQPKKVVETLTETDDCEIGKGAGGNFSRS